MKVQQSNLQQGAQPIFNFDSWKWIISLTLIWPIAQLIIFYVRFGHLPNEILTQSLYFAPLGFFSALLLRYFQLRSNSTRQYWSTTIGYFLFAPVALFASLLSGLILPPLIGPLIYGIIPLAIGVVGGFFIGRALRN